ncbi:MAG: intradiol ring-cleavage dioxygenase [Alphaproteobacteria bacterium]|nr:intradiol ring-cleavage dioxygenase [Alphaproteobacteria bacterium]
MALHVPNRRTLLAGAAGLALSTPLQAAVLTPRQTAGPFYPEAIPAESDMDLTQFSGGMAQGEVIEISGAVFSEKGNPLPGTVVELWQANAYGRYHHSGDDSPEPRDPHFQGFGAVSADKQGAYRFRTVLPGLYPGRTRHLHFRLVRDGRPALVTQMYFPGENGNARDGLFNWLGSEEAQQAATARLMVASDRSKLRFDFVMKA